MSPTLPCIRPEVSSKELPLPSLLGLILFSCRSFFSWAENNPQKFPQNTIPDCFEFSYSPEKHTQRTTHETDAGNTLQAVLSCSLREGGGIAAVHHTLIEY